MTLFLTPNTPLEDHLDMLGLLVKREDLSCPPPGPPFSKTRGVLAHVKARYDEGVRLFGVLDTYHSQAGHAVAAAVDWINREAFYRDETLGKGNARVLNFFPVYKADTKNDTVIWREPQVRARDLNASLWPLPAGRSAILYHQARKITEGQGGYMMPNALKLPETVTETAAEVRRTLYDAPDRRLAFSAVALPWIIACSSGTIAAGVLRGLDQCCEEIPQVVLHMGYHRSADELLSYVTEKSGVAYERLEGRLRIINEGYAYKDKAKPGAVPPWPCNEWYDLKAFRWWMREGLQHYGRAMLWNIG